MEDIISAENPPDNQEITPESHKPKHKGGRPSMYTKKLANEICEQLSKGRSLNKILKQDGMPSSTTVMKWLWRESKHKEEFVKQYTRARQEQAEHWADETIDIADEKEGDYYTNEKGKKLVDHENINRSRLRVDTRKWFASKLLPKKYGDKMTLAGDAGAPLVVKLQKFKLDEDGEVVGSMEKGT